MTIIEADCYRQKMPVQDQCDVRSTVAQGDSAIGLERIVVNGNLRRLINPGCVRMFCPTEFDRNLLKLADAAVNSCIPTALVLPIRGTNTGVLLAAAILISHFVRTRQLTAQVALVTKQLQLRSFYDTLHIGQRERLGDYFPRTIVTSRGGVSGVGNRTGSVTSHPGRLHFVSQIRSVEEIRVGHHRGGASLDGLVIESQASEESVLRHLIEILAGKVPILYLTTDPYDSVLADFERTGAVWAWDAGCVYSLIDSGCNPDSICIEAGILEGVTRTTFEVVGPDRENELDRALATLWDDLAEIQTHSGEPGLDTVQWVWGVFGALSQLVVPVDDYDRYARSGWGTTAIADAVTKSQAFARNALHPEDREYWHILADDLEDAVGVARRTNPKPEGLVRWVRELVGAGEGGLVVVRNRAALQAAHVYLQAQPDVPFGWESKVNLTTLTEILAGRVHMSARRILCPGPVSSRYASLFALPAARQLTVLAHGPWEASRAVRQINGVAERLRTLAHGPSRLEAVRCLFGGSDPGPECTRLPVRLTHTRLPPTGIPRTSRGAVWDPFDVRIVRSTGRDDRDAEGPARDSPQGPRTEVTTICIGFAEGFGFFEPDCIISRVEGGDLKDVAAKALLPGDRIILVECGALRNLFDLMMEKLEHLPEFAATAMLVHEWHERARRAAYRSDLTYEDILRRMRGTPITSAQTIGTWIRGDVHGPADPEDIRRFGRAVGDEFLTQRFEAIGRALATMRWNRRKIGHMLAKVLNGMSNADLEDEGYFDRRLGIHWSDFAEAVSDHFVTAVSKQPVRVPYQYANRLLSPAEATRLGVQEAMET